MRASTWSLAAILFLVSTLAAAAPGYFRDPAIHGDTVVFVAEGDLWRVSARGGQAVRLTTHPALESQPVFSPDGASIAFAASYDGVPAVYVMPLAGGEPKRLSFDGGRVWLAGWTPGGEVAFASDYLVGPGMSRVLRSVDPKTGVVRDWPLADARELALDADGRTAWFTRFGLAVSGDHAVGYRGGAMAQLWRWEVDGGREAVRIAEGLGANVEQPMWWQGRLYVVSDAGGRANLWTMGPDGGNPQALTQYTDFDVRSARLGDGRIVYQLGADLHVYDIAGGNDRTLSIRLDSDFLQRRERFLDEPLEWLASAAPDAEGRRAVLTARGHGLVAGTGKLRRAALAAPAHARLRAAEFASDGKSVFAITDVAGGSEIRRYAADGSGTGEVLLADEGTHRWRLWPSPDGRWLAHADKRGRLSLLDLKTGVNRMLDESPYGDDDAYGDVAWSADGRHLAWSRPDSTMQRAQLFIAEAAGGDPQVLTSDRYESFSPAFSPDGRWLWFLSNRNFRATPGAPWGDRNLGPMFDRRAQVFALALQPGLRLPFLAADELGSGTDDEAAEDKGKAGGKGKAAAGVHFAGLAERLFETGIEPGNYEALAATAERLYFLDRAAGSWGRADLRTVEIKPGKTRPETFRGGLREYRLSADGKRLLLVTAGDEPELLLVDAGAKAPEKMDDAQVRLDGWRLAIKPVDEWQQMFDDAWRMHRAFSFDPAMRGADWNAVRARFAPLVERVTDRWELDDLLGQMSAEHGILHSQVRGGEYREDPAAPEAAFLGARLEAAPGGVRIAHILRTDPELPAERAPLAQPGVDAAEGDLITAVNGRAVASPGEVALALRAQAGEQVRLELRRGATSRPVIVRPVDAARDEALRYSDWVEGKRARVEEAGGGRIGYLHLYAMIPRDIASFAREFYAQYQREGLIIDVRRNRGGNIDSWVIEKLLRRAWAFWQPPHGTPETNMQQAFRGHVVVLADEFTYSDGETFTAGIKALKVAPVIGHATAGAGVWLSDRNRLADGGLARVAETGQFDVASGRWLVEGRGVSPDVEVENLPWATARGEDAQLEAAIARLQEELRAAPVPPLRAGPITPLAR